MSYRLTLRPPPRGQPTSIGIPHPIDLHQPKAITQTTSDEPGHSRSVASGLAGAGEAVPTAINGITMTSLRRENARLRRDNENLSVNLEVAIANIQRLTLQAHQLREALEHASGVTRLPRQSR